jgi:hypothetical protein
MGQLLEFCNYKIENVSSNKDDNEIWKFILVKFIIDNNKLLFIIFFFS